MKKYDKDLTTISPAENYTPPELPMLEDVRKDPMFLKTLPQRWKNNAKILTCMGLIGVGVLTLSSCDYLLDNLTHNGGDGGAPIYVTHPTEQDVEAFIPTQIVTKELEFRAHYGGSGAGPFYVVHMTEQEAMSVIRSQLEIAGLRFDAIPPAYTVTQSDTLGHWETDFNIDLFDADRGVAIVNIGNRNGRGDEIAEEFERRRSINSVGVFWSPIVSPDAEFGFSWDMDWGDSNSSHEPTEEEIADAKKRARPILEERLYAEIQEFINVLITEGLLEP